MGTDIENAAHEFCFNSIYAREGDHAVAFGSPDHVDHSLEAQRGMFHIQDREIHAVHGQDLHVLRCAGCHKGTYQVFFLFQLFL